MRFGSLGWFFAAALVSSVALTGCDGTTETMPQPEAQWAVVTTDLPGALLSIWGSAVNDVWVVGADALDGSGPTVMRYNGSDWEKMNTGQTSGDLWWVYGFKNGPVYMGGAGGVILKYEGGAFTLMTTPGTDTVFGIWGSSPTDLWAVGGAADKSGFAWRLSGDTWTEEPSLPADMVTDAAIWKVFGKSANDAWLVGSNGVSFHWDGSALTAGDTGIGSSLFTVHANSQRYAAVGGLVTGFIVENTGSGWTNPLPEGALYGLTGVVLGDGDEGYAVGQYGSVYERGSGGWQEVDHGLTFKGDLHAVWLDSEGGVWAVGGQTASYPLTEGVLIHKGEFVGEGGL